MLASAVILDAVTEGAWRDVINAFDKLLLELTSVPIEAFDKKLLLAYTTGKFTVCVVVTLDRKQFEPYRIGVPILSLTVRLLLNVTWPPVTLRFPGAVTIRLLETVTVCANVHPNVLKTLVPI
jgi:hypothetical protein